MAAGGVSVLQPLLDHLGVGWTFTLFAGLCTATTPMLLAERMWGMQWRKVREGKAWEKTKKKTEKEQNKTETMKE